MANSRLPKATLDDMQEKLDLGHTIEDMVNHYHEELGTQKEILREELEKLVPSVDSPAGKAIADALAKAAKTLEKPEEKKK